jgi:hypothetical protein
LSFSLERFGLLAWDGWMGNSRKERVGLLLGSVGLGCVFLSAGIAVGTEAYSVQFFALFLPLLRSI